MKRINKSGQEAIEFALISGLVFIAALGTVLLFGNKLATFFTGGAVSATASQAGSLISSNSGPGQFTPNYSTEIQSAAAAESNPEAVNIDGVDVTYNADGSVYFNIGGQNFNIPAEAMGAADDMFKTAKAVGVAGLEDQIMQAFIQMIKEYQQEHPGEEVPAEWIEGNSVLTTGDSDNIDYSDKNSQCAIYGTGCEGNGIIGDASINIINLQVGDKTTVFVVNHTQIVNGQAQSTEPSVYKIEGSYMTANDDIKTWGYGSFSGGYYGEVTSLTDDTAAGIYYNQNYSPENGPNIGEGLFYHDIGNIWSDYRYDPWLLDFSQSDNHYNISGS